MTISLTTFPQPSFYYLGLEQSTGCQNASQFISNKECIYYSSGGRGRTSSLSQEEAWSQQLFDFVFIFLLALSHVFN